MSRVRALALALFALSGALLALRLVAAARVGFGDSEALYAAYAVHPAPAYLDHPGLIALFARLLGGGSAPDPVSAHRVTAVLCTLAPSTLALAARAVGASWDRALVATIAVALVPEIAVGLFGMTPDLLLFPLWMGCLGLAGAGLSATPASVRAAACLVVAGLLAGVAVAAKASAAGLVLALLLTYASPAARAHARTAWPWAGLALGAIVVYPVFAFEAASGWPMLHHRLVATQEAAGVSLRNLGALVGGQLVYVSPVFAAVAVYLGVNLVRERRRDVVSTLLAHALLAPLALLVPLCLWSKVAEPHWVAPALLALPLHYARSPEGAPLFPARLARPALALAFAMSAFVYVWVLFPGLAAIVPNSVYDPRVDIANELYGWPEVIETVEELAAKHGSEAPFGGDIVVVGPHWVVSAQLEAGLARRNADPEVRPLPVGCAGRDAADFAVWNPPDRWADAELLFYVRDNRFPGDSSRRFPDRVREDWRVLELRRGGRVARSFEVELLVPRGVSLAP